MFDFSAKKEMICRKEWYGRHKDDDKLRGERDFITIKDTITGRELRVTRQTEWEYMVDETMGQPEQVRKRFIGKVIRTWMKERKKDV